MHDNQTWSKFDNNSGMELHKLKFTDTFYRYKVIIK